MEGIDQNYVVYDKMLEMGWRNQTPDLNQWSALPGIGENTLAFAIRFFNVFRFPLVVL